MNSTLDVLGALMIENNNFYPVGLRMDWERLETLSLNPQVVITRGTLKILTYLPATLAPVPACPVQGGLIKFEFINSE